jgi:hypothetical protein
MVAASLLKLTAKQFFSKYGKNLKDIDGLNYIAMETPVSSVTGQYKAPYFRIAFTDNKGNLNKINLKSGETLGKAIKDRNKLLGDLGYTKPQIKKLTTPTTIIDRSGNVAKKSSQTTKVIKTEVDRQKTIDELAENFNKDDPSTWKGLVDITAKNIIDKKTGKLTRDTQFMFPTNKKIKDFIVKKFEVSRQSPYQVRDPNYDPNLTSEAMQKLFMRKPTDRFAAALLNLGIKQVKGKTPGSSVSTQIRQLLNKKYYTPGQKAELRRLDKIKQEINAQSGAYINPKKKYKGRTDKALETEHTQAIVSVLKKLKINPKEFLENADPKQITKVGRLALKDENLRAATKLANNEKDMLFENTQMGGYWSKDSAFNKMLKIDSLRNQGKLDEANALEDALKTRIIKFQLDRAAEAAASPNLALKYDTRSYDWLPEFARISNDTSIYGKYNVKEMSLGEQLAEIAKEREIVLEGFVPKTSAQFAMLKSDGGRVGVGEGGRIGKQVGGVTPKATGTLGGGGGTGTIGGGPTNKVGTIQSILAGIGAGIIDIPRGAFTLGAALMDLGLGTNKAAKVEQWFDDLTEFDETAEQSTLASLVRTLTNLGIPGAAAWKMGTQVTKKALLAKRNGNYFRITDPALEERMKTALNAKGRIAATLGGAAGAGVSDAIFVGDPETVGTMGDMFGGGPTELTPNDSTEASREVMNRIKFGVDGALFLGVIGGTGSSIKSAIARRNDLSSTNSTLDKFLSKLRPRGAKPQEFFDLERRNIGLRAGDVNYASEVARKLDKHIDAIFPFVKNPFDKMGNKGRAEFMDELNETLLSGRIEMDVTGKSAFGEMDPERVRKIIKMMRDRGAKQKDIDGVLDSFEQMRLGWAHMFSRLGYSMADADPKVLEEFKGIIGDKFKSYLGSTYEIFQNKSLIPLLNYAPTEEAVNKAVKLVQDSARTAGKTINDEEARHFVDKMVESARLPRGLATSKEKTSGIYLEVPDFFANKTVLSDLEFNPKISLDSLTPDARKVIDEVLGKVKDPMQTMLAGSGRLSLITRRNQFYEELMKKSADDIAAGNKGFFYETELDAFNALGGNIKKIEIDPTRTIEAGITNPLNGKYAERGVAEAIEESAMLARDKGTVRQMYDSLILYPKATSQIAKTILSPITHVRNFVSAGAFAGANGLIPGLVSPTDMAAAMKDAYKALQIPGARMANDAYRELLRLGVVNSNVRLGDLQRLLQDVNFGETLTAQKGLRGLMRPLSKAKKWTEEMYTAEDDFWKITSYALERQRLSRAYGKYGIKVNDELLNEEAASIVRNNIPNYDMVNDFIKGLRQLPFGNFVSFPAEIMRTSTNILGRALKEINYQHTLDDGRVVNPLRDIGYKRLFGFGTTVVAVPYGTVEAAKAIYDVTEDEMKAMRRFVPGWSQNSTLVPIRDTETGELKYVDFSHANAYDTMIRPINTMINSVGKGIDEGEIMKNVALGMFDATKETVSPFISESIWFEGASDIFLRGGRTREGRRLWTEATPWGEKVSLTVGHLVKTQMPGSIPALNRMGLAIREEVDEYGRTYEFGDELAGIFGFRAVKVDPIRSMKFKIADFRTGINAARREFTAPLLRGGVVDPADVVDRFEIANEAAYKVQQDMFKDYYGARTLGVNTGQLDLQFADRVSGTQLNAIKAGKFKPFIPSDNIKKAFADNARAIGAPNGYLAAERQIQSMIRQYNNLPLFGDLLFPKIENPFIGNTTLPNAAVQGIQPVAAVSGMQGGITAGGINNPNLTAIKGQQVFGSTDPIFGVG